MPRLNTRLSRKADGTAVLACEHEDGSTTWQRHRHAFFPMHDLTHFAVETTLRPRYGFYRLLVDGWSITDFGDRQIPSHAETQSIFAESIVGLLDQEMNSGAAPGSPIFNTLLKAALERLGLSPIREISESELEAIRELRLVLSGRWTRTEIGESVELVFETDDSPNRKRR